LTDLSQYELSSFPPTERLLKFSELLGLSMHALIKGEKLSYKFDDSQFGEAIINNKT
jgi:hypothetical protein